jgi:hypothetical protein
MKAAMPFVAPSHAMPSRCKPRRFRAGRSQVPLAGTGAGAFFRLRRGNHGRIEAMTGVRGALCVAAIGGALLAAAPLPVACGPVYTSGGSGTLLHKAVYPYEVYGPEDVPFYDEQNYCWQQVWTPNNGWLWVDVCHGYAF